MLGDMLGLLGTNWSQIKQELIYRKTVRAETAVNV